MAIAGDWPVVTGGSIWVVDLRQLPVLGVPIVVPGISPCSCYDGIAINLPCAYVSWGNAWLSVIDLAESVVGACVHVERPGEPPDSVGIASRRERGCGVRRPRRHLHSVGRRHRTTTVIGALSSKP